MSNVISRLEVRSVGQGAFVRGSETKVDRHGQSIREIRWIYDCGTAERVERVEASVSGLHEVWEPGSKGAPLDLLVVSHFDKDHISGLPYLFSGYRFSRIVLPFAKRLERFFYAIESIESVARENVLLANELIRWTDDPVAYVGDQGWDTRFVVVRPAGDDEHPAEQRIPSKGGLDLDWEGPAGRLSEKDVFEFSRRGGQVYAMDSGATMAWDDFCEFVPYVDAGASRRLLNLSPSERQKLDMQVDDLNWFAARYWEDTRATHRKIFVKDLRARLKALKEDLYTAMARSAYNNHNATADCITGEDKNAISLMAFIGPTSLSNGWIHKLEGRGHPIWGSSNGASQTISLRSGTLLTGDANLYRDEAVDQLIGHIGARRIASLGVAQVPHHGSRHSASQYFADRINAPIYFFNANPAFRNYHHPDPSVVACCQFFVPPRGERQQALCVLVNEDRLRTIAISTTAAFLHWSELQKFASQMALPHVHWDF